MFYYWLIPLIVFLVIVLGLFSYSGKHKAKGGSGPQREPEPIRRGKFLNK